MTDRPVERLLTPRTIWITLALLMLFSGVYWLTFSGTRVSNDELFLFDAIESFVHRGEARLSYGLNERTLTEYAIRDAPDTPPVDAEPLQILAAAPLFWVAERLPGVGILHTVWLLNVVVSAAAAALMFVYARVLGYREGVGIAGALLLGLGTLVWPYSKGFFREPLALVLLFTASLCLHRWRRLAGRGRWAWFVGFAGCYLLALLTKEAALLSIPIYFVLLLPGRIPRVSWRKVLLWLVVALVVTLIGMLAISFLTRFMLVGRTYNLLARLQGMQGKAEFMIYALVSYLVSPGRSLLAFTPVALLAPYGVWLLKRQGRTRDALLPVAAFAVFVVGYAVVRNENWFAGRAWGPRYLFPVTPFVLLALLPVLERAWRTRARWLLGMVLVLVALSVWAQINGVLIAQYAYFQEISRRGVIAWQEGVWQLEHTPLLVNPPLLFREPLDIAWLRVPGAGLWLPGGALLLIGGATGLLVWSRQAALRWRHVAGLLLGGSLVVGGVFYVGLRSIYPDPAFQGNFAALQDLTVLMDDHIEPGDIVVLPSEEYQPFILNYYRGPAPLYVLKLAPGEQPSPDQPPQVTSTNPDRLLESRFAIFLDSLPEYTGRIWLLNNSGPFTGYTVRPVEWYLARHYFPVLTLETDQTARLVAFDVNSDAPPEGVMRWPDHLTDARFGEAVALLGYDLPPARERVGPYSGPVRAAETYQPGDVVPLSLLWEAAATPEGDYSIGVFVVGPAGTVAEQQGPPQWAFRPMNTWAAGQSVRDNHGLQLPPDLPPGTYQLWVKVVDWRSGTPLPVSGEDQTADGTAALLGTIEVITPPTGNP